MTRDAAATSQHPRNPPASGPNPAVVARSFLHALRTRPPRPTGRDEVDHGEFEPILAALASGGVGALPAGPIASYIARLATVDPDGLSRPAALAFWMNIYNAGALDLARRAHEAEAGTVLRVPGGFTSPFVTVAGEDLSLDDVEHGKVRRFGDPRIHAALVCGSASCPTLRFEPYEAARLEGQLDGQMRAFLASGGAAPDPREGRILLSRIMRWYGADFARPHRMPALVPARGGTVLRAVAGWLGPDVAAWIERTGPRVVYQRYDWTLGCAVGGRPG